MWQNIGQKNMKSWQRKKNSFVTIAGGPPFVTGKFLCHYFWPPPSSRDIISGWAVRWGAPMQKVTQDFGVWLRWGAPRSKWLRIFFSLVTFCTQIWVKYWPNLTKVRFFLTKYIEFHRPKYVCFACLPSFCIAKHVQERLFGYRTQCLEDQIVSKNLPGIKLLEIINDFWSIDQAGGLEETLLRILLSPKRSLGAVHLLCHCDKLFHGAPPPLSHAKKGLSLFSWGPPPP